MVIAALVSFAILLLAWIAVPDRSTKDAVIEADAGATDVRALAA